MIFLFFILLGSPTILIRKLCSVLEGNKRIIQNDIIKFQTKCQDTLLIQICYDTEQIQHEY